LNGKNGKAERREEEIERKEGLKGIDNPLPHPFTFASSSRLPVFPLFPFK
jgi:hypothetical protein